MNKLFFPLFIIVIMVSSGNAQSTLGLQKKCAEEAKTFVERLEAVAAYNSNYNKGLNRCYARVGFYFGKIEEDRKMGLRNPHWKVSIYNLFDGKIIGTVEYIGEKKQECWVGNKNCNTIEEFDRLQRPFMGEE